MIRDLTDARQRLDKGDWKGSIRASCDAVEVLRGMHDEHLSPRRERGVEQREAAILDAERQLIQSLFDYGSATLWGSEMRFGVSCLIRNLTADARWPRSIRRLRAACVVHAPSGLAVTPAR